MSALLQVVASSARRGAEVFASDLGERLGAAGHAVSTVALTRGAPPQLELDVLGPSARSLASTAALRRRAQQVGAVLAHGSSTLEQCALVRFAGGPPFAYRSIGDLRYWADRPGRRPLARALLARATIVVALWPAAAEVVAGRFGVDRRRVRVIPNAVDATRFEPATTSARLAARERFGLAPDADVVLYLGALAPEKDPLAAVRAVAALKGPSLLMAGTGPLRPHVAALAHSLGLHVVLAGALAHSASALAAADAVILPSLTEGMSAVLIEAGLCALPVVATEVGATAEVVEHGETGVLAPVGDVAALSGGLRRVLSEPAAMGRAARERCLARFDIAEAAQSWAGVVDELTGGGPERLAWR